MILRYIMYVNVNVIAFITRHKVSIVDTEVQTELVLEWMIASLSHFQCRNTDLISTN